MIVDKGKAYDTTLKAQNRHNNGKKELASIKAQMVPLQESMDSLEKNLRLRNEEINRLQDSLAIAQANIARTRQKARTSLASSISTSKRFVKFLNLSIFIDSNDSPFEDWSLKLYDKLTINENYFEIDKARAAYVVGRINDNVFEHINVYRVTDVAYFKIVDMVIKVLKGVYANLDRQRNARQKYLVLKQETNQKFASFFSKFARLDCELGYIDAMLRQDFEAKLNRGLKSIIVNNSWEFDNLSQMKDYLIIVDNVRRRIKVDDDRDDVLKKVKTTNKSRYTSIYNENRIPIYIRIVTIVAKPIVALLPLSSLL